MPAISCKVDAENNSAKQCFHYNEHITHYLDIGQCTWKNMDILDHQLLDILS